MKTLVKKIDIDTIDNNSLSLGEAIISTYIPQGSVVNYSKFSIVMSENYNIDIKTKNGEKVLSTRSSDSDEKFSSLHIENTSSDIYVFSNVPVDIVISNTAYIKELWLSTSSSQGASNQIANFDIMDLSNAERIILMYGYKGELNEYPFILQNFKLFKNLKNLTIEGSAHPKWNSYYGILETYPKKTWLTINITGYSSSRLFIIGNSVFSHSNTYNVQFNLENCDVTRVTEFPNINCDFSLRGRIDGYNQLMQLINNNLDKLQGTNTKYIFNFEGVNDFFNNNPTMLTTFKNRIITELNSTFIINGKIQTL